MSYLDDCNHEIAQLRASIRECYAQSMRYEEEGDTVNANIYLTQAGDLHEELRAALDYREQCLVKEWNRTDACSTCEKSCRFDPTDMDQCYQLDVLLNELQVMGGQIEYLQDENDFLQDELKDAEDAIGYWENRAQDNDDAQSKYDDLVCLFQEQQRDYHDLEKTLFSERTAYEKANDFLHDDIIDLQYEISKLTKRLQDTSERAADYWKRIKTLENSND